jgi:hypothetical protein
MQAHRTRVAGALVRAGVRLRAGDQGAGPGTTTGVHGEGAAAGARTGSRGSWSGRARRGEAARARRGPSAWGRGRARRGREGVGPGPRRARRPRRCGARGQEGRAGKKKGMGRREREKGRGGKKLTSGDLNSGDLDSKP